MMKTETTPYNPFDYLENQNEIDAYLAESFGDEDPRVFLVALGFLAKKKGMAEVAKLVGVNRESLYKSLSGDGNPAYTTVAKVVKALGVRLAAETAHC
jgi:probable addiction module antidote protein